MGYNMHTLHTVPSDESKIVISKHCLNRFLQRFRLYLTLTETQSTPMQIKRLRKMISKGSILRKFEFSPFLINKTKITQKHHGVFYVKAECGYFVMKEDSQGTIVALTVVKSMK